MDLERQTITDEAGPELAGALLGRGASSWRGVSLHLPSRSRPWQCHSSGDHSRTEYFADELEAAAWAFVQHRSHLLPQLLALQPTYPPLLAVQRHARTLGAPLLVARRLAAAQQAGQAGQAGQQAAQQAGQQHATLAGAEAILLQHLLDANPLPPAPAADAPPRPAAAAPQRTGPQDMERRVGFLHRRRGLAAAARLTPQQLLPGTVLMPGLRHSLLGLSTPAACSLYDALAAARGLPSWQLCHLDHVHPLALLCAQTQLPRGLTLSNLRPLTPPENLAIRSRGMSLVQGRAGQPPLCRRLPGGQLAGQAESQQVIAAVEAESQQHEAALGAELQRRGHDPAACGCGPCHLAAAPSQPFVSQQQVAEVREQQVGALWMCAGAVVRRKAVTLVPGYAQPWQMSAFLRHGATCTDALYMPLLPPLDGYGAGMGAQLAGEVAREAVQLYMQLAAERRAAAGLGPLPAAEAAAAEAALRGHLRRALMARRRGGEEAELDQAEEAAELAWAADWEGQQAAAAAAAAAGGAAGGVAGGAAAAQAAAAGGGAAAGGAAAAAGQAAAAPQTPEAAERERQERVRQQAVQQLQQHRAQQAQQGGGEQPGGFLPPTARRPAQQQAQQAQQAQQQRVGQPGTGRRARKRAVRDYVNGAREQARRR